MLRMKRVQLNIDRDFECVSMAQMPLPEHILVEKGPKLTYKFGD